MTELIITHPGGAHFDEMTAISLILAVHSDVEFQIERREPSPAELDDPGVWVVDTGKRHEPEKRNFDHHQSLECPASFVLVAQHLGIVSSLCVLPWWHFKDCVDRIGPVKASAQHGAGDELINRSPIENWLVDQFATAPQTSLPLLKSFGAYLIDDAQRLIKQIDLLKAGRRLVIAGIPAIIAETTESFGLEEFRRLDPQPPDIVISLDGRSEGWRLFRYEGALVDFSLIAGSPEIEFSHKTGFLAKTRNRLPLDELIPLVSRAVIPH